MAIAADLRNCCDLNVQTTRRPGFDRQWEAHGAAAEGTASTARGRVLAQLLLVLGQYILTEAILVELVTAGRAHALPFHRREADDAILAAWWDGDYVGLLAEELMRQGRKKLRPGKPLLATRWGSDNLGLLAGELIWEGGELQRPRNP
jgi:hypothetical protein